MHSVCIWSCTFVMTPLNNLHVQNRSMGTWAHLACKYKISVLLLTQISNKSMSIWSSERYELRSHICGKLKKKVHKFVNFGHSDLFISLVSKHICVKYEGSMINHTGRRDNYENSGNLKTTGQIDLTFHVHMSHKNGKLRWVCLNQLRKDVDCVGHIY